MPPATLERPGLASPPAAGTSRRRTRRIAVGVVVAIVLGTEIVLATPYLSSATTAVIGAERRSRRCIVQWTT